MNEWKLKKIPVLPEWKPWSLSLFSLSIHHFPVRQSFDSAVRRSPQHFTSSPLSLSSFVTSLRTHADSPFLPPDRSHSPGLKIHTGNFLKKTKLSVACDSCPVQGKIHRLETWFSTNCEYLHRNNAQILIGGNLLVGQIKFFELIWTWLVLSLRNTCHYSCINNWSHTYMYAGSDEATEMASITRLHPSFQLYWVF